MFQFPQNGYKEIDLPRGIDHGERRMYILAKGYVFAKVIIVAAECGEE